MGTALVSSVALHLGALVWLIVGTPFFPTLLPKGTSTEIELVNGARVSRGRASGSADPQPRNVSLSHQTNTPSDSRDGSVSKMTDQTQADSGSTAQAGTYGAEHGVEVSAKERYLVELRAWLERHRTYPRTALRMGLSGEVVVAFRVERGGQFSAMRIQIPSRFGVLNESALELVKRTAGFKPLPSEIREDELEIAVPINYSLN